MGNLVCVSCRSACPQQGKIVSRSSTGDPLPPLPAGHQTNCPSGEGNLKSALFDGNSHNADSEDTSKLRNEKPPIVDTDLVRITIPDRPPIQSATVDTVLTNGHVSTGISEPSAWDIYLSPELQNCVSNGGDTSGLSELERVAKGIVDVNLFIASQVIYPALERYRLEHQRQNQNALIEEEGESYPTLHGEEKIIHGNSLLHGSDRDHHDASMTIRVDNGIGIRLIDKVTMY